MRKTREVIPEGCYHLISRIAGWYWHDRITETVSHGSDSLAHTNTLFRVEHDPQLNVVAIIDPLGRNAETYSLDVNERVISVRKSRGQALQAFHVGNNCLKTTRLMRAG